MNNSKTKLKQMKLTNFCEEFDVPRSTALKWIHANGFPAYRLSGHWYIDIDEFYLWRKEEHTRCYKYA